MYFTPFVVLCEKFHQDKDEGLYEVKCGAELNRIIKFIKKSFPFLTVECEQFNL